LITPASTGRIKRHEHLATSSDIKPENKFHSALKPGKLKEMEKDILGTSIIIEQTISKTPNIMAKKEPHIFNKSDRSFSSMSDFNLGESELNTHSNINTNSITNLSHFGRIALRDDFTVKKPHVSPSRKIGGLRKSIIIKVNSLKSIEEENKLEESELSKNFTLKDRIYEENILETKKKEQENDFDSSHYANVVIGTESNKNLISEISMSPNKWTLKGIRPSILKSQSPDKSKEGGNITKSLKVIKSLKSKQSGEARFSYNNGSVYSRRVSGSVYNNTLREKDGNKMRRKVTFSEQINISQCLEAVRKRFKRSSLIQILLICISILLIIIDNELEHKITDRDNGIANCLLTLRFINTFITIILFIIIFIKIKLQNEIFRLTYLVANNKCYSFSEFLFILLEFVISCIFIPPYIETIMNYEYFLNNFKRFISILCFFKIYPVFNQILLFSPFQNKKARFLRSLMNLDPSWKSLLQSWFQENRYIFLAIFPFIFFPTISYILMLAERTANTDYFLDAGNCVKGDSFFPFIWITGVSFFTSNNILT
jgi:hypothetical protein